MGKMSYMRSPSGVWVLDNLIFGSSWFPQGVHVACLLAGLGELVVFPISCDKDLSSASGMWVLHILDLGPSRSSWMVRFLAKFGV